MQKSLTQMFNESAAAAHTAFPDKLKNLVILSTGSETPVYVSPEIADYLSRNVDAVREAVVYATNYMYTYNLGGIACFSYPLAEAVVKRIGLNEDVRGIFSSGYTKEMRAIYILDHEIGHLAVKNGASSSIVSAHLAECAADAYAALRHIQRFGKNTEFFEYSDRTSRIVLGLSPIHYTENVFQRVKQLSEEKDISSLSLHETAELAAKIASECHLTDRTLGKIRSAFQPVNDACKDHIGSDGKILAKFYQHDKDAYALFCRETLAVMQQHQNDPDILKAGKEFLNYPPIKKFMQELASTAPQKKVVPCRNP